MAALLRQILDELKKMAENNVMPTMAEWDAKRPANMLPLESIIVRLRLSWADLAYFAELHPNPYLRYEGEQDDLSSR